MDLKELVRAVASFGLDPITEKDLDKAVREIRADIEKAKSGNSTSLKKDIWNTAMIFRGLEREHRLDVQAAYSALRAYIAHILAECPNLRKELVIMFAKYPNLRAALL